MTNDERISYLEELVQTAYNGYAEYKPFFDKLNDAYLLLLESEQYHSLKERNKSKNYIPKLNSNVSLLKYVSVKPSYILFAFEFSFGM